MSKSDAVRAREMRQERVGKVVWGLLFIAVGVLFTLHNLGEVDLTASPEHAADKAVDGDAKTRWSSEFRDPQWITVDLGQPAQIGRIRLNWEVAYAREYELQVSTDGSTWTTVKHVTGGDGGIDEHEVAASARYVRVYGTVRATPYGYSLWELEVYGAGPSPAALPAAGVTASADLLSQRKTATASSTEPMNPWPMYWPVLLVAAGLPLLIAPKDGGNQVVGFLLTAVGSAVLLRNLGFVDWDFKQAMAIVLILAGLALVVQARRQVDGSETRPDGGAGGAERLS